MSAERSVLDRGVASLAAASCAVLGGAASFLGAIALLLRWTCFDGRLDGNGRGASWTPAQHLAGLAQACAWLGAGVLMAFAPRIVRA